MIGQVARARGEMPMTTQPKTMLDPELREPLEGFLAAIGGGFDLGNLQATREMVKGMIAAVKAQVPPIGGVDTEDRKVPGRDGQPDVPVRVYRPSAAAGRAVPALLWMHAGGWMLGDLEMDDLALAALAKEIGCVIVSVDYRLSPEHRFPAALHDCYAALAWLADESRALGVDPARIAVGGASAGGNLAASLALLARQRGGPRIAYQLLIYPSLDDRTALPASDDHPETYFWSRQNSIDAWTAYLGHPPGRDGVPTLAAPARATDLTGLPPAYIAVGTLDPFLDENIDYARKLIDANVACELRVYPGAFHAFDVFASQGRISQQFAADRNAALRRNLFGA